MSRREIARWTTAMVGAVVCAAGAGLAPFDEQLALIEDVVEPGYDRFGAG